MKNEVLKSACGTPSSVITVPSGRVNCVLAAPLAMTCVEVSGSIPKRSPAGGCTEGG